MKSGGKVCAARRQVTNQNLCERTSKQSQSNSQVLQIF